MYPSMKPMRHLLLSLGTVNIRNTTIIRIWNVMDMPLLRVLMTSIENMGRKGIIQRMLRISEILSMLDALKARGRTVSMKFMRAIPSTEIMQDIMQTCSSAPSGSH
ncbi:hypothetical protein KSX_02390 [Ktedonospora formicarum]|uniref:Uncharacterized protein n=1 Tax=Ktedonospora formicarum TaxID=2778364 RepID=A0A8J3HU85_9CHLR|nr:hypothetical protein KSX_02390 [Ktedonospora formicarum]